MTTIARQPGALQLEPMRFTVDQYHRMIEDGILVEGSPYELIDGFIVPKNRAATGGDPMTIGDDHVYVVQAMVDVLAPRLRELGCHLRVQQPLVLPPYHEPEADGAIARGSHRDYRGRIAGADDLTCVLEAADRSLEYDRTVKLRMYAGAGIGQYVILNLIERVAEVYTGPVAKAQRYAAMTTVTLREQLAVMTLSDQLVVPLSDLLP